MAYLESYEIEDVLFWLKTSQLLIKMINQQFNAVENKDLSPMECIERVSYLIDIYQEKSNAQLQILTNCLDISKVVDRS